MTTNSDHENDKINESITYDHVSESDHTTSHKCTQKTETYVKSFRVLGTMATILIITGLICTGFWKIVYHRALVSKLKLRNDTDSVSYSIWNGKFEDLAYLYFNVYMFNWTNPKAALSRREKATFNEIGPYVFRIRSLKEEIIWNTNDTISFRERRKWNFIPERSIGSLSDNIVSLNVVPLTVANKFRHFGKSIKIFVDSFIKIMEPSPLYIVKTVEEFLFDGYRDNILDFVEMGKKIPVINKLLRKFPDKFGWYYGKNYTGESDVFTFYTGKSDSSKLGLLHSWNYSSRCNTYRDDCDIVRGSKGVLWPSNAADRSTLALFVSDMCGHFDLNRAGYSKFHGISGIRFEGTEETLDNGTKSPKNRCYCPNGSCQWKSGVRDLSKCVEAPIFVSFPHFYAADAAYRDAIIGMAPNADKHKFGLTLQQDSGLVMEVNARLQINVLLEPIDDFSFLANVPEVFIPVLWFEEVVELAPDLIGQLRWYFITLPKGFTVLGLVLISLGATFIFIGLIVKRKSYERLPYTHFT